jgi:hypothetical protein
MIDCADMILLDDDRIISAQSIISSSDKPILKLILSGSEISSLKNVPTSLPSTLLIISPTSHP